MDADAQSVERAEVAAPLAAAAGLARRLFSSEAGASDRQLPRWIFLRALGLIYFSAFYALLFQIRGLIGPRGLLPAGSYLHLIASFTQGVTRYWHAPTLLWLSSSSHMLLALCWVGIAASLLLVLNLWPRGMLALCFVCFLSFVAAAQAFADYQSDGMLLEAGLIALFFAPPGFWPGLGRDHPASRFSLFLLQWEWFRIYFQSGVVKLASGDPEWRHFTAMDHYYQNCPLPTWIGWYAQHLPHWFQAATVGATLLMELGLVWMICLPRRFRVPLFVIVTCWQAGVILTANYAFLNYLVLSLGILLLDDRFLVRLLPCAWRERLRLQPSAVPAAIAPPLEGQAAAPASAPTMERSRGPGIFRRSLRSIKLAISAGLLLWLFYASSVRLLWLVAPRAQLPTTPVAALQPFRVADQYGLFAVMTRGLYQVEFQGSRDGVHWTAYPFRYKPQALSQPPGIYAPYQPRFDWNLWFASLDNWRNNSFVPSAELGLLRNDPDILHLFACNPFAQSPPVEVRAVLWRYWFTSFAEKRATGDWWRRQFAGLYAPVLERQPDGSIRVLAMPGQAGAMQ